MSSGWTRRPEATDASAVGPLLGHSRRNRLRATIGPRPLRPESGSEIRRAPTTQRQQLQDLKHCLQLAQQRVQAIKLEMRAERGAE